MLDTCPPRQCLTWSIFEINPSRWVSIQISYVIIFIFSGPFLDRHMPCRSHNSLIAYDDPEDEPLSSFFVFLSVSSHWPFLY